MRERIAKGLRRTGVFVAMAAALVLAVVMAVLLFGIQSVFGLLNKLIR